VSARASASTGPSPPRGTGRLGRHAGGVEAVAAPRDQEAPFMKDWFRRLIAASPSPTEARRDPVAAEQPATPPPSPLHAALVVEAHAGIDLGFVAWMVQMPADSQAPIGAHEQRALEHLDHLAADPVAHAMLLPRTAAVVPQLLARLRAETSSLADLKRPVTRDMTLVAEVIGMANSPYYRRDEPVVELEHAIRVLGVDGLRSAIARVVLKPLIDARGSDLVARGARRLWEHTDKKAQLCAALARSEGLDPFDAYLLGLVHNAAWNVVLRAIDRVGGEPPWRLGSAFVAALGLRRDRLFAAIARQWQLQDSLAQVAAELAERGFAADASPRVLHLYAADRLASLACRPDAARAAGEAGALLAAAGEPVRECYQALVHPRRLAA
jgi:hypothetical protein